MFGAQALAESVSALYVRGYTAIPEPQQVKLEDEDFRITTAWRLELGRGVEPNSAAVEALKQDFEERHGFKWAERGAGPAVHLAIQPNSVPVGEAQVKTRRLWPSRLTSCS